MCVESRGKVCVLTSVHSPLDIRIFHKEARALSNFGYQVTLIAPYANNATVDHVRIKRVPFPKNRVNRMTRTSWQIFRAALEEKADIYHLHDPELIPVGLALKVCGFKVIYDVHEDTPGEILVKDYIPRFARGILAWSANIFEKSISKTFDAIVAATDDIAGKFTGCRRVVTVKNFPALSHLLQVQRKVDQEPTFRCIYVGDLTEVRGVTQIVGAMGALSDLQIKLVLCGRFYPDRYQSEVRGLQGAEKIHWRGWVNYESLPQILAEADVGLVCLQPVGQHLRMLPTKLFEYMAAGLPVVASKFPLWKEIVEHNRCGICVDSQNPQDIANAIRFLYDHPEIRLQMGINGRRAVREIFNWENQAKILTVAYRELLSA